MRLSVFQFSNRRNEKKTQINNNNKYIHHVFLSFFTIFIFKMSQNGEVNPLEITEEELDMPTLVNPIVECAGASENTID